MLQMLLANDLWEGWQPEQGAQELECARYLPRNASCLVVPASLILLPLLAGSLQLFRRCVTNPITIGTIGLEHFYENAASQAFRMWH